MGCRWLSGREEVLRALIRGKMWTSYEAKKWSTCELWSWYPLWEKYIGIYRPRPDLSTQFMNRARARRLNGSNLGRNSVLDECVSILTKLVLSSIICWSWTTLRLSFKVINNWKVQISSKVASCRGTKMVPMLPYMQRLSPQWLRIVGETGTSEEL